MKIIKITHISRILELAELSGSIEIVTREEPEAPEGRRHRRSESETGGAILGQVAAPYFLVDLCCCNLIFPWFFQGLI